MDAYIDIANRYFHAFEGRRLYPNFRSWHWYAWMLSFAFFVGELILVGTNAAAWRSFASQVPMFVAEILFLATSLTIDAYKRKMQAETMGIGSGGQTDRISAGRKVALERLCGKPASSFAATAKEVSDLLALQRSFRSISDAEPGDLWKKIYDPESKARLLSITLAAIALFVALLTKSADDPLPNIVAVISDQGVRSLLAVLIGCSVALFGIGLGLQTMLRSLTNVTALWIAKLGWSKKGSRTALNYLVRDLVRFYEPIPQAHEEAAPLDSQVPCREPANVAGIPSDGTPERSALA